MAHQLYLQRSFTNADPWTTLATYSDNRGGALLMDSYLDRPGQPGPVWYRLVIYPDASASSFGRSTLLAMAMNK